MPGWQFRPAKQIQRLMVVDVMRRMAAFRPLRDYRYLGFGGFEFIDFDMVRRQLGVQRMTSIESVIEPARIEFNKPFGDVDVCIGSSNDVLDDLDLAEPLLVWMDYCDALAADVIQDLALFADRLSAGSMLIVTVNADPEEPEGRFDRLVDRIGLERVPPGTTEDDLDIWGMAAVQRKVMHAIVADTAAERFDGVRFEQLVNVRYRDTVRMQTWGGVIVDPATEVNYGAANFPALEQVRQGEEAVHVNVPVLTAREVLYLESGLIGDPPAPRLPWQSEAEAESFAELHRWYPRVPAPM